MLREAMYRGEYHGMSLREAKVLALARTGDPMALERNDGVAIPEIRPCEPATVVVVVRDCFPKGMLREGRLQNEESPLQFRVFRQHCRCSRRNWGGEMGWGDCTPIAPSAGDHRRQLPLVRTAPVVVYPPPASPKFRSRGNVTHDVCPTFAGDGGVTEEAIPNLRQCKPSTLAVVRDCRARRYAPGAFGTGQRAPRSQ